MDAFALRQARNEARLAFRANSFTRLLNLQRGVRGAVTDSDQAEVAGGLQQLLESVDARVIGKAVKIGQLVHWRLEFLWHEIAGEPVL